jgi:hypothetical protein
MSRITWTWVAALTIVGLFLFGCDDKKKEETKPDEAAKTAESAKPAEAATAKVPSAEDTAEMVAAAAEFAKGVDTSDAPDYMKDMVKHINGVTKAIQSNLGDCAKAAEAANAYVDANKAEIEALSKKMETAADKLSDPDKMKMAQQLMGLLAPTMADMQKAMTEFAQKCPTEAAAVGKAMDALKAK